MSCIVFPLLLPIPYKAASFPEHSLLRLRAIPHLFFSILLLMKWAGFEKRSVSTPFLYFVVLAYLFSYPKFPRRWMCLLFPPLFLRQIHPFTDYLPTTTLALLLGYALTPWGFLPL